MTLHPDNPDRMLRDALDRTAERSMTNHPPPPEGFETWLGYVIATCPRPDALTYAHSELWHARSELARLRRIEKAARPVLKGIDDWNESVQKIVGRQANYEWGGLEELRAALEAKP